MTKVMKTAAYTEQLFLHVYPLRLAFNFISKSHNKKNQTMSCIRCLVFPYVS